MDLRDPWIALRNLWIHTLRGNPWIAQESVDRTARSINFAYDTIQLAHTYMDRLVIFTNLKCNYFTQFVHGTKSETVGVDRARWLLARSTDLSVLFNNLTLISLL